MTEKKLRLDTRAWSWIGIFEILILKIGIFEISISKFGKCASGKWSPWKEEPKMDPKDEGRLKCNPFFFM